jgi:hypothetical protein
MSQANLIMGYNAGQYGEAIPLTVVDINNNALNISAYTTQQVILQSPDQLKRITYTASYPNSGIDGRVTFTPAQGDVDRDGNWLGQLNLLGASLESKTVEFTLVVGKSLS